MPPDTPNFVHREVVVRYLNEYCDHFDIRSWIKLRHQVIRIEPVENLKDPNWPKFHVTSMDLETEKTEQVVADILLICNGHNGKPNIPLLHNIEQFRGSVIHSAEYRVPEVYQNKNVAIIGGMVSANDIACALLPVAKKIILCRRVFQEVYRKKFLHVLETTSAVTFGSDHIILEDGTKENIDAVILATGFDYDFPFLTPECRTEILRGRVKPLYRHLIHCEFHSMAFVGLFNVVPFLAAGADPQIQYYKAVVERTVKLPPVPKMFAEVDEEFSQRLAKGFKPHWAHKMINQVFGRTLTHWLKKPVSPPTKPVFPPCTKITWSAFSRHRGSTATWSKNESRPSENEPIAKVADFPRFTASPIANPWKRKMPNWAEADQKFRTCRAYRMDVECQNHRYQPANDDLPLCRLMNRKAVLCWGHRVGDAVRNVVVIGLSNIHYVMLIQ
ncbi:dimethylaniline monooxygenase [N-oxide-forming] 4-like isoform X2 [Paramacrobiotus metropolitanus]|uniref:dimethylaniline monooxygenase [N-oxide-forming] 4-like isoform X2 n=1 Tax=Paramacrobiotus metropolitanus TaxID=2943436 RepID=UPI002445E884|nr:dimethylaniline monooxygenase [N-oxide-forming] 4-like isoform X2 [Paramacrobiotus metropolitanus]